jgi:hypothetical protein
MEVSPMDRSTRVRRNPAVVSRPLSESEGGVLLHLESGAYHRFNPIGFAVWELLDDEMSVADLITGIQARVADAPPELERDVLGFVEAAIARDLIVPVP